MSFSAGVLALVSVLEIPVVIWFGSRPGLTHLQLLASTSSSLKGLARARLRLTWSFLMTLGYWILLGFSAWILAYGMDIDISFLVAILLMIGTLTFVALAPSLPASVRTFEFAVFYLLTTIGMGDGDALVIHVILFMPPILIAILAFATWAVTGRGDHLLPPPTCWPPRPYRTNPRCTEPSPLPQISPYGASGPS